MRATAALFLVALLAVSSTAFAQQKCRMEYQGGSIEYPCGSGESAESESPSNAGPWWNSVEVWLSILGIGLSLGAGAFTLMRVRARRQALTVTLAAIESTYAESKTEPDAGLAKLAALRTRVRADHQKGRLDDAHFLELDRRATQYLVKLRLLEIDRRFAALPPLFLAEIRRLLSDGVLSQAEADLIEVRAAAYRVNDSARAELVTLTRRWAGDDGMREPAQAAPVVP